MVARILPKSTQNLLVVGPIHNKFNRFEEIQKIILQYDWVIFNDGISFNHNNNNHTVKSQINEMDQLLSSGKVVYVVGNQDLSFSNTLNTLEPQDIQIESWIRSKPNVVIVNFNDHHQVIVLSGGIPTDIKLQEQLLDNLELSFFPHPHQSYTGGLGYVITNQPLTVSPPVFHRYSAQIGNTMDGQIYALSVNAHGVQRTILV